MLHIIQAAAALILLIGLPLVLEPPTSAEGMLAAAAGALVLVALAIHGMVRFVSSRTSGSFPDSILAPPPEDVESTVVRPKRKAD